MGTCRRLSDLPPLTHTIFIRLPQESQDLMKPRSTTRYSSLHRLPCQLNAVSASPSSSFYLLSKNLVTEGDSTISSSKMPAMIPKSRSSVLRIQVMPLKTFATDGIWPFWRETRCLKESKLPLLNNGLNKRGNSTRCLLYLAFLYRLTY